MKISIENYNPDWKNQFLIFSEKIGLILKEFNPRIEHIGSTSVPNLAAKPIIDIMVGLEKLSQLDNTIKPMTKNNFIYYESFNELMPNRRFFIGLKNGACLNQFKSMYTKKDTIPHKKIHKHKIVHIHIWGIKSLEWTRHIAFREYLITHPKIALKYEQLKRRLSHKDWIDGNEYNQEKNNFIKLVESKAIQWYNKTAANIK